MNTFQRSLASTPLAHGLTTTALGRWAAQRWMRARLDRLPLPDDRKSFAGALPRGTLPTTVSAAGHYFRSDPAWVSGVFSGFLG
jgi:hypothetical protein